MSRLTELINHYEHSVEYLAENWDVTTRHMEMGEIRQHREYCQIENNTLSALKELQRYKELAEAGRLIELPCKVGDTVYYIDDGEIYYDKASSIEISKEEGKYIFGIAFMDWKAEDFGKKVFLSEAEAYRAELKEGDQ